MSTFVIGGKRYRVKSKARFMTFITAMILTFIIIISFALTNGVSGAETKRTKAVTIKSGDTLWTIAETNKPEKESIRAYIADIRKINKINPGKLHPGQIIDVPVY